MCIRDRAYAGRNYLPFLIQPYSVVRPLLFNCLEIMQLRSTSQDAGMERMIAALPVSYTHLDVYKRQTLTRALHGDAARDRVSAPET